MKKGRSLVTILLGSQSDLAVMEETLATLEKFGVGHELVIASAHRSPERTRRIIRSAEAAGAKLFIAAAGGAAHLPGVVAAETALPVIGVPIDSSALKGMDALLSIVQMPGGVPVATMAIGKAGARNAAVFAAQCLALQDAALARRLRQYKQSLAEQVEQQDQAVRGRASAR
ncbi:MAG: 5-(carboxyamino)imidazole ribonucleotide mutase [Nitrospirota bacterium]